MIKKRVLAIKGRKTMAIDLNCKLFNRFQIPLFNNYVKLRGNSNYT